MSNDVKLAESEADNVSDQACVTKTCDLGDNNSSLNLFKIPHTRMKELVTWPLKNIPDLDVQDLEPSLQVESISSPILGLRTVRRSRQLSYWYFKFIVLAVPLRPFAPHSYSQS